ncbi:MAG: phosphomannomutase, partial [Firmicutes bacterium]|nr:phosphomannomutase [Bacillota bacterium]
MLSDKFISMFREYDVRGRISEDELCDRNVERIAKAFAVFLSGRGIRRVVVGYDNRKASLLFYNIVVETLANSGFEVIAVGLTLSPVVYFAQHYYQSPGAIMVTASHNPDGWSGFKMSAALSTTLSKDEIQELLRICADGGQIGGACGIIRHENVRDAYI